MASLLRRLHNDNAPVQLDIKSEQTRVENFLQSVRAPEGELAQEIGHNMVMNFNNIAPFGRDHSGKAPAK